MFFCHIRCELGPCQRLSTVPRDKVSMTRNDATDTQIPKVHKINDHPFLSHTINKLTRNVWKFNLDSDERGRDDRDTRVVNVNDWRLRNE